jgi:hypothetical protein
MILFLTPPFDDRGFNALNEVPRLSCMDLEGGGSGQFQSFIPEFACRGRNPRKP